MHMQMAPPHTHTCAHTHTHPRTHTHTHPHSFTPKARVVMLAVSTTAGLCEAAVEALRRDSSDVTGRVLAMLFIFFRRLPRESRTAAMAVLVAGGAVELTVAYMAEVGLDIPKWGLEMLMYYTDDPCARERMCAPGMVDQIIKWFARWLPPVRGLMIPQLI
jgi:hypothetical protein